MSNGQPSPTAVPNTPAFATEDFVKRECEHAVKEAVGRANEHLYKQASWDRLQALGIFALVTLIIGTLTFFLGGGVVASAARSVAQQQAAQTAKEEAEVVSRDVVNKTAGPLAEKVAVEAASKAINEKVGPLAAEAVNKYLLETEAGRNLVQITDMREKVEEELQKSQEAASRAENAAVVAEDKSLIEQLRKNLVAVKPQALRATTRSRGGKPSELYSKNDELTDFVKFDEPVTMQVKRAGTVILTVAGQVSCDRMAYKDRAVLCLFDSQKSQYRGANWTVDAHENSRGWFPFHIVHVFRVDPPADGAPVQFNLGASPLRGVTDIDVRFVELNAVYLPDALPEQE